MGFGEKATERCCWIRLWWPVSFIALNYLVVDSEPYMISDEEGRHQRFVASLQMTGILCRPRACQKLQN